MEFLNNYNISAEIVNSYHERMTFAFFESFKGDKSPIDLLYDLQLLKELKINRLELNTKNSSFLN